MSTTLSIDKQVSDDISTGPLSRTRCSKKHPATQVLEFPRFTLYKCDDCSNTFAASPGNKPNIHCCYVGESGPTVQTSV